MLLLNAVVPRLGRMASAAFAFVVQVLTFFKDFCLQVICGSSEIAAGAPISLLI